MRATDRIDAQVGNIAEAAARGIEVVELGACEQRCHVECVGAVDDVVADADRVGRR